MIISFNLINFIKIYLKSLMNNNLNLRPETIAIRSGTARSQFNEHSEGLFLTSSFLFEDAQQAEARFGHTEEGMVYSRFTNPTVEMLQKRLALLEGGESCLMTASGMSAINTALMGLLKAGDHVVASRSLFGATIQLFTNILARFGIETTFVSQIDSQEWQDAIRPNTKVFYLETPSNPLIEIADLESICNIAHQNTISTDRINVIVDNCFCTSMIQKPLKFGADIVVHSATKYLDGQGRVLGGAIIGSKDLIMNSGIYPYLRTAGPSISPFNAWVILKGLETLNIRMKAHCENALNLATWLETLPQINYVNYPFLESHKQHDLAKKQQTMGGGIVTFEVKGGKENAWKLINSSQVMSITGNLGDTRSTITHPASTTHGRISPEARQNAGITDGLVRISVGLEHVDDLKDDILRGL